MKKLKSKELDVSSYNSLFLISWRFSVNIENKIPSICNKVSSFPKISPIREALLAKL